jgi:hypothetical protein
MMINRKPVFARTIHGARRDPPEQQTLRRSLVRTHTYEITFVGQAGSAVRAEFDDCAVSVGADTTTLRTEVADQAALWGIVQRIIGLGLQVIELHLVAMPPSQSEDMTTGRESAVDSR